ncbi:ABC transporter permease [Rhodovulum sulfidophilum]|uniref:ABC transporter permease n=1 Tax=Rhodovulum sulfidophilum TaxID=35806 RepID=UPI0005AA0102|nr:ABC transporter permease [Rhodovulum sulfidophilum]ANB33703.1 peptide ABC transporter permease [Rhodovulum sulfidophilum DSM 1374]ANB37524.1 peptide ABC transporter permease [Rhodovulum sulfidophilum]MCW2302946.1 peptide/nickel transport system permease protein [Rhodovulum sulfidophilum]
MAAPSETARSETARSVHAGAAAAPASVSPFRQTMGKLLRDPLALTGLVIVTLLMIGAVFAPLIAPQDPYDLAQLDIMDGRLGPGSQSMTGMVYLLGTDDQGRDLFSAILFGLRTSILVGLASAAIALVIGASVGLFSAYAGGRTDAFLMRIVDIQLSFPAILIALIFLAILGQGVDKIILALVVTQWAYYARTIRGSALVERKRAYVDAARSMALPDRRILFRHILPNCLAPLIVVATMRVAYAIMLEATLSFLGIGLPVTEPSLGLLVSNGFEYLLSGDYWISFFPGLALLVLIVSINLIGDALRDILNPRREG